MSEPSGRTGSGLQNCAGRSFSVRASSARTGSRSQNRSTHGVGTEVETFDAVLVSAARGEHEDGNVKARLAHLTAHAPAIAAWQTDVENHEFIRNGKRFVEAGLAIECNIDCMRLLAQTLRDHARCIFFVFN